MVQIPDNDPKWAFAWWTVLYEIPTVCVKKQNDYQPKYYYFNDRFFLDRRNKTF